MGVLELLQNGCSTQKLDDSCFRTLGPVQTYVVQTIALLVGQRVIDGRQQQAEESKVLCQLTSWKRRCQKHMSRD